MMVGLLIWFCLVVVYTVIGCFMGAAACAYPGSYGRRALKRSPKMAAVVLFLFGFFSWPVLWLLVAGSWLKGKLND